MPQTSSGNTVHAGAATASVLSRESIADFAVHVSKARSAPTGVIFHTGAPDRTSPGGLVQRWDRQRCRGSGRGDTIEGGAGGAALAEPAPPTAVALLTGSDSRSPAPPALPASLHGRDYPLVPRVRIVLASRGKSPGTDGRIVFPAGQEHCPRWGVEEKERGKWGKRSGTPISGPSPGVKRAVPAAPRGAGELLPAPGSFTERFGRLPEQRLSCVSSRAHRHGGSFVSGEAGRRLRGTPGLRAEPPRLRDGALAGKLLPRSMLCLPCAARPGAKRIN